MMAQTYSNEAPDSHQHGVDDHNPPEFMAVKSEKRNVDTHIVRSGQEGDDCNGHGTSLGR